MHADPSTSSGLRAQSRKPALSEVEVSKAFRVLSQHTAIRCSHPPRLHRRARSNGCERIAPAVDRSSRTYAREIIALRLEKIGRQSRATEAVVECQRGAECGHWDTARHRGRHNRPPGLLTALNRLLEKSIEQQVREIGVLVERLLDVAEKSAANDTTAAPHQRDAAVVQVPAIFLGGCAHEHVTLGVGDNLRGIQSLPDLFDEFHALQLDGWFGTSELL